MVSTPKARPQNQNKLFDWLFVNGTRFFALLVLSLLAAILASLIHGSQLSIHKFGWHFLTSFEWNSVTEKFGAASAIIDTLITSLIALFIAVPVSFGIALFLTELSPTWLRRPLGIAIELLAGIPSIIYGIWGLFVFAPFFGDNIQPWVIKHLGVLPVVGALFQGAPMGMGLFTAALILSIMIIPYISSVMRDVFEIVPSVIKESAYGLGSTTWEVVWNIVLPYTKAGVVGGIMLGLGRALGETMAVTFVIGNSHDLPTSLFAPGNTIASTIANEFNEAVGDMYNSALIELSLILFFITLLVLILAKLMLLRLAKGEGGKS